MIVDEAHRLKNFNSALYQELSQVCMSLIIFSMSSFCNTIILLCCDQVFQLLHPFG